MDRLFQKIWVPFLVFLLLMGCSQRQPQLVPPFEPPPHARHLKGLKICLDPGHGGQGHVPNYKRGPTGLREADINLRVALHLREMLQAVGATVIMTRVDDSYVSLSARSQLANESGADFFISLHHNGISNPSVNYTSTWYHGDADAARHSLDLARYIQLGVSDALQLPTSPASGLYSDKLVRASGFGVLRMTECPAVLCEASFLSHPEEEERLRADDYLRREAYGYFLGLARYAEAGFPKGVLVAPQHGSVVRTKTPRLQIQVMDGLHERGAWMLKRQQVFSDSIRVSVDGAAVPHVYDPQTDEITVTLEEPLSNGLHTVETELVNYYGNRSLPSQQEFKVAPPAATLAVEAWTDTVPADGKSYVGISVAAYDVDGMPIADGEQVLAETSFGRLAATSQPSENGLSHFYLYAPDTAGTATVKASYGEVSGAITIRFSEIEGAIVQGRVVDTRTGGPLAGVQLQTDSQLRATTDAAGHFFVQAIHLSENPYKTRLRISKAGYYPEEREIRVVPNQATVVAAELHPIADGAFASTLIVLDSQTDTARTEALIAGLEGMLKLAGAEVYNLQTSGVEMSVADRIARINAIEGNGYYLQINHEERQEGQPAAIAAHYRGNYGTETLLKQVLQQLNTLYETPIVTVQDTEIPEIQQTNKMAMVLRIRSLKRPNVSAAQEAAAVFLGAWRFFINGEIPAESQERFMGYLKRMQQGVEE